VFCNLVFLYVARTPLPPFPALPSPLFLFRSSQQRGCVCSPTSGNPSLTIGTPQDSPPSFLLFFGTLRNEFTHRVDFRRNSDFLYAILYFFTPSLLSPLPSSRSPFVFGKTPYRFRTASYLLRDSHVIAVHRTIFASPLLPATFSLNEFAISGRYSTGNYRKPFQPGGVGSAGKPPSKHSFSSAKLLPSCPGQRGNFSNPDNAPISLLLYVF